jgi:hypothetical protein
MKKLRRLLSIGLLLSFAVLFTPRDWWHDCHHDEDHVHVSDGELSFEQQEDCFICDYHLGYITPHTFIQIAIYAIFSIVFTIGLVQLMNISVSRYFSLRAPPFALS